jgi:hypothetical protein
MRSFRCSIIVCLGAGDPSRWHGSYRLLTFGERVVKAEVLFERRANVDRPDD